MKKEIKVRIELNELKMKIIEACIDENKRIIAELEEKIRNKDISNAKEIMEETRKSREFVERITKIVNATMEREGEGKCTL